LAATSSSERRSTLVEGDEARPTEEARVVGPHLLAQGAKGLQRGFRGVQDVEEDPGPGDVPEELEAQALPLARPLNDAGDVGQGEANPLP
jgi:hypothetical protein